MGQHQYVQQQLNVAPNQQQIAGVFVPEVVGMLMQQQQPYYFSDQSNNF
jgi:hypothetical protein